MKNLTDEQLLNIYNSDFEYSYITKDNEVIHINDYESIPLDRINYCIFHSDFETMFGIKDELIRRSLLIS